MASFDAQQVRRSVGRLAEQFHLTGLAKRQLRIYYEVILQELSPRRGVDVKVDTVERFMKNIARSFLYRQNGYFPGGVEASDLLHAWDYFHNRKGNLQLPSEILHDVEEGQIVALLDKD